MAKSSIKRFRAALIAAVLLGANFAFLSNMASAASLSNTYMRLSRMKAGQGANVRLYFRTSATGGGTNITINMNGSDATPWTSASGSVVNGAITTDTATCVTDTGATALPGTLSATGNGSNTITITGVTTLAASTNYCVDMSTGSNNVVTNATAGEYHPTIAVSGGDSTTIALRTVTSDQVVVSATVPPSFNFQIDSAADNFTANLSSGSVGTTSGRTVTVNTNATTGWIAWAQDSNTGLASTAAAKTIASTTPGTSATLVAGTEGYTFGVTSITQGTGAGVTSASAAYDATGAAHGSGLDSTLRVIASSTGTASGAVLTVKERAAISALTPAATDYTDTITIVGAGSF